MMVQMVLPKLSPGVMVSYEGSAAKRIVSKSSDIKTRTMYLCGQGARTWHN